MISYFKTIENEIEELTDYQIGCWINCIKPSEQELNYLMDQFKINAEFLRSSTDREETSHIDYEDENTLIIIDIPVVEKYDKEIRYKTIPLGIIITPKDILTICIKDTPLLAEIAAGAMRQVNTNYKTQFVLYIMLGMATKYLRYLKQIDKMSNRAEKKLRKSMQNKELVNLLEVEKSLVYFSSSLKYNEATLEKIMRGRVLRLYEEDQELLEDVLIEIKQAIEMSSIYINILSGTMDAFASVISNNLNIVMKILASITLIISIPTVIAGIYGMNTPDLPMLDHWWFPVGLSCILMFVSAVILKKMKML